MTNGEARVLETDAVIFVRDLNRERVQIDSAIEKTSGVKFEEATKKLDIKKRFARFKKSLRKRSVSIL